MPHPKWFLTLGPGDNQHSYFPVPHSRLLLWEVLLGPLLSLSTVVVFSVTSTLDGEREGDSGGWGRVSELGGALEWPPHPIFVVIQTLVTQRAGVTKRD